MPALKPSPPEHLPGAVASPLRLESVVRAMIGGLLGLLIWATPATPTAAAELLYVEVKKKDDRYFIASAVHYDARIENVYRILIDYDNFKQISSMFKESRYIERNDDGSGVVFTLTEGCLVFFCQTIERTEYLEVKPVSRIVATAIPEQSNMKFSRAIWELSEDETGTHMRYSLEMEPDFWVPPLLGRLAMKWVLKRGGQRAAERIEQLATENDSSLPGSNAK
ncbi:MAG: SRPBCC family protein [Gammaproteobacteria bacterium]